MSTAPEPLPRAAVPPAPPPTPPARFPVLGCAFALSFVLNLVGGVLLLLACMGLAVRSAGLPDDSSLSEKFHSGSRTSSNKVAVVSLDGVLMEGLLSHVHKQIDAAAKDNNVKAVVFRVNSPGGSITSSDDLYRRLIKLRDGDKETDHAPKTLVASMGAVAASGGYYVSVPAAHIFAEPVTITGSIGVYGSFPRLSDEAQKNFGTLITVKAGEIKDTGSMFRDMSPKERQVIQDMVNESYVQFLDVIEKGRPKLTRAVMLQRFPVQPLRPDPNVAQPPAEAYTRYRADGGTFSGKKAQELGLVDDVGTLDDAIREAAKRANIDSDYRAFKYQRKATLSDVLFGVRAPATPLSLDQFRAALTPRLWYLAAGYEAAARLAAGPVE